MNDAHTTHNNATANTTLTPGAVDLGLRAGAAAGAAAGDDGDDGDDARVYRSSDRDVIILR